MISVKVNALVRWIQTARVGRARERSETQGFMQVLVDAETKLTLGATLLGDLKPLD